MTFLVPGLDIEEKGRVALEALWESVGGEERFRRHRGEVPAGRPTRPGEQRRSSGAPLGDRQRPRSREGGAELQPGGGRACTGLLPGVCDDRPARGLRAIRRVLADLGSFGVGRSEGGRARRAGDRRQTAVSQACAATATSHGRTGPARAGPDTSSPARVNFGRQVGGQGRQRQPRRVGVHRGRVCRLDAFLTVERLRRLIPETGGLEVERFAFPNLAALNFVIHGLLGEGVASSTRLDPQAKTLGEYLRAKLVDIPQALLG